MGLRKPWVPSMVLLSTGLPTGATGRIDFIHSLLPGAPSPATNLRQTHFHDGEAFRGHRRIIGFLVNHALPLGIDGEDPRKGGEVHP